MNTDREPQFDSTLPDPELPPALVEAIGRARAKSPTPENVAQLVARASRLAVEPIVVATSRRSQTLRVSAAMAVAAVTVFLAFAVYRLFPRPTTGSPDLQVAQLETFPSYSEVTKSLLVDVGFRQIEDDLRAADSQVVQAEEAIELAEVRRDLRATLEEYPRWGH